MSTLTVSPNYRALHRKVPPKVIRTFEVQRFLMEQCGLLQKDITEQSV
jgi:hypothetical protein